MISYMRISSFILSVSLVIQCAAAYDNGHFYRATNAFYEPRLERGWLSSLQITFGGGSTNKSRSCGGFCVPLFDLYGTNNMQQLGVGVPDQDLQNSNDLILIQLANLPSNDTFGRLSIGGHFRILESNIFFTQNLIRGFFVQGILPVRNLKVSDLCFEDISPGSSLAHPNNDRCPNANTPIWKTFLQSFGTILARHGLSARPFNKTGVGDLTILVGWTTNYQEMDVLDYIDMSIRAGFLAPTSPTTSVNELFALPLGYDGHWGFPLSFDVAFGAYEWMTLGGHIDAIIFGDATRLLRMKTACAQQGIVKLALGCADVKRGILWNGNVYFKADHVIRGFSFLLGYSFTKQNESTLMPKDPFIFNTSTVNTDAMFKAWEMHTLHFAAEWDFTCNESVIGNHIGIFYNHHIGGRHVFQTSVAGAQAGINIAWDFN